MGSLETAILLLLFLTGRLVLYHDSMIPPKNELLVIDTDDFPSIYQDLLSKSTAAKYEQEKSVEAPT